MKKFLFVFLLMIIVKIGSGQVLIALLFGDKLNSGKLEFGLMAGPTFSNITNIDAKLRPGLGFGLFFDIKVSDNFYLHPEALPKLVFGAKDITPYATGSATLDSIYTGGSVKRNIKAIGLPLLVRYRIAGLLFAEGGPQINMTTKTKDIFKTKVNDDDLFYENKTKGEYTRFDVGYALGLAYKLKPGTRSMAVGARYYGGFTDIMKNAGGSQKNSAWSINVYIPVGGNKATKSGSEKNK